MKIVIVSPLYPPDTASAAVYTKELAKRLSRRHETAILTYSRIPEKITGVHIAAVDKRKSTPLRLMLFTLAARRAFKDADVIYLQNGASAELPAAIAALISGKKFFMGLSDRGAIERSKNGFLLRLANNLVKKATYAEVNEMPDSRPEILPFHEYPKMQMEKYESSWQIHIDNLEKLFRNEP